MHRGVVRLPSGRLVRGRALRHSCPSERPDFAVHLARRRPAAPPWESRWVKWPDFWVPSDHGATIETLRVALDRAGFERVEVACFGGRGRTGTALAAMAVLDGLDPDEALRWVRRDYHPRSAETPWQRRWLTTVHR